MSATIGLALRDLIRIEHLGRDVAAYDATPVADDEIALASVTPDWTDLADRTDWDSLYRELGL